MSMLGLVCAGQVLVLVSVLLQYVSGHIGSSCWWVVFHWSVHSPKLVKIASIVSFLYDGSLHSRNLVKLYLDRFFPCIRTHGESQCYK